MNRTEKIDLIQETIGDKNLVRDTKFITPNGTEYIADGDIEVVYEEDFKQNRYIGDGVNLLEEDLQKIVSRSVMLGDVIDWITLQPTHNWYSNTLGPGLVNDVCRAWKYRRKPIEDQSDELLDLLVELIENIKELSDLAECIKEAKEGKVVF